MIFEKLAEEGGGEINAVSLVPGRTVLSDLEHRVHGDSEEEASGVDHLGRVNYGPVGFVLEMGDGELIGRVKLGDQGPVLVCDEDSAPTCGLTTHLVPTK